VCDYYGELLPSEALWTQKLIKMPIREMRNYLFKVLRLMKFELIEIFDGR
jgi:hypothetical protein